LYFNSSIPKIFLNNYRSSTWGRGREGKRGIIAQKCSESLTRYPSKTTNKIPYLKFHETEDPIISSGSLL
jgi:hypothetical protein